MLISLKQWFPRTPPPLPHGAWLERQQQHLAETLAILTRIENMLDDLLRAGIPKE